MLTSNACRFSDGALVSYTKVDMHLSGAGKEDTSKRRQERSSSLGQTLVFGPQRRREIFGSWEQQEIFDQWELLEIFGPRWR